MDVLVNWLNFICCHLYWDQYFDTLQNTFFSVLVFAVNESEGRPATVKKHDVRNVGCAQNVTKLIFRLFTCVCAKNLLEF
jgi:hypothetical protein